jgi:hypothetical protein
MAFGLEAECFPQMNGRGGSGAGQLPALQLPTSRRSGAGQEIVHAKNEGIAAVEV